jgi:alpha-glucosidase (family GH31 glycosyl hydrolase)
VHVAPGARRGERRRDHSQHGQAQWAPNDDESLYGLGQHQQGLLDIKGYDLDFHPYNTEVFVPFLVSSRGYGILWDNASFARFGDLRTPAPVPGVSYDASGNVARSDAGASALTWQGSVQAPVTGDYLFYTYSSGTIALDVNGTRVVDHWRQGWLPGTDVARVHLTAGQSAALRLQWTSDIGVDFIRFNWKTPNDAATTSLWSEVGDGVDYYFAYGPELDQVTAGYRRLTGQAPMMPAWAYGFFSIARPLHDVAGVGRAGHGGEKNDFWTGVRAGGGQTVSAAAPYDAIPVYVRAGSILPTGPDVTYVGEKPADPITLYAGADGAFSLYEDQGSTYDYERGEFARIPIQWADANRTLTIGARQGSFAGMPSSRTFNVIVVTPDRPVGFSFTPTADRSLIYTGAAVTTLL